MFSTRDKLDVTQDEIAVIHAALETQAKILTVQAGAGGSGARRRLNEVKKVLARVSSQYESSSKRRFRFGLGWFGFARTSG